LTDGVGLKSKRTTMRNILNCNDGNTQQETVAYQQEKPPSNGQENRSKQEVICVWSRNLELAAARCRHRRLAPLVTTITQSTLDSKLLTIPTCNAVKRLAFLLSHQPTLQCTHARSAYLYRRGNINFVMYCTNIGDKPSAL